MAALLRIVPMTSAEQPPMSQETQQQAGRLARRWSGKGKASSMRLKEGKWKDIHYTPRQLSKKIGVTYSMAQFIVQSCRQPCQAMSGWHSACVHPAPGRWTRSGSRSPCTRYPRSGGRAQDRTDSDVAVTSCSKAEEGASERVAPLTSDAVSVRPAAETGESAISSLRVCARSYCKSTPPGSPARRPRWRRSAARKAALFSRQARPRRLNVCRRKGARAGKCQRPRKPFLASRSMKQRGREIPIRLWLDVPVSIYLGDAQEAVRGGKRQAGSKRRSKDAAVQVPSLSSVELVPGRDQTAAACGQRDGDEGELRARQQVTECQTGAEGQGQSQGPVPEEISCEPRACPTGEEDGANLRAGSRWWERIRNGLLSLEAYLENIIQS